MSSCCAPIEGSFANRDVVTEPHWTIGPCQETRGHRLPARAQTILNAEEGKLASADIVDDIRSAEFVLGDPPSGPSRDRGALRTRVHVLI